MTTVSLANMLKLQEATALIDTWVEAAGDEQVRDTHRHRKLGSSVLEVTETSITGRIPMITFFPNLDDEEHSDQKLRNMAITLKVMTKTGNKVILFCCERYTADAVRKHDESQRAYKRLLKGEALEEATDAAVLRVQKLMRPVPFYRHEQQMVGPAGVMKLVSAEVMGKLSRMTEAAYTEISPEVAQTLAETIVQKFLLIPESWTDLGDAASGSAGT